MKKDLEKIRTSIREVYDRLALVEPTFTSKEETLKRIDNYLDSAENLFETDITGFVLYKPQAVRIFAFSEVYDLGTPMHADALEPNGLNVAPLFATFMREQFKAWLISQLEEYVADEWGTTTAEVKARENDLRTQLFELECKEEALIEKLEATGEQIERRFDIANPLVLVLKDPTKFAEVLL